MKKFDLEAVGGRVKVRKTDRVVKAVRRSGFKDTITHKQRREARRAVQEVF